MKRLSIVKLRVDDASWECGRRSVPSTFPHAVSSPSVTSMLRIRAAESLSLLFALSFREGQLAAQYGMRVGVWTISATALWCGQATDRTHTPGCRRSPLFR